MILWAFKFRNNYFCVETKVAGTVYYYVGLYWALYPYGERTFTFSLGFISFTFVNRPNWSSCSVELIRKLGGWGKVNS